MGLPVQPVPAPGFEKNPGRRPPTGELRFRVQFANGYIDDKHTYTAAQLRWTLTGSDWDVGAVAAASKN